jgi:hypothetical protein
VFLSVTAFLLGGITTFVSGWVGSKKGLIAYSCEVEKGYL